MDDEEAEVELLKVLPSRLRTGLKYADLKRARIVQALIKNPRRNDSNHAEILKVSYKTVGLVRRGLEEENIIPTVGKGGISRTRRFRVPEQRRHRRKPADEAIQKFLDQMAGLAFALEDYGLDNLVKDLDMTSGEAAACLRQYDKTMATFGYVKRALREQINKHIGPEQQIKMVN